MVANYVYFVEGENEKKLVEVLKSEFQYIVNGKVYVHNVLTRPIHKASLRQIKESTTAILLFDTDNQQCGLNILRDNMHLLEKQNHIKKVLIVLQVKNIEDELIRSTDIRKITDLLQSRNASAFKGDFNRIDNRRLRQKLEEHHFSLDKLWILSGSGIFSNITNESNAIKIL